MVQAKRDSQIDCSPPVAAIFCDALLHSAAAVCPKVGLERAPNAHYHLLDTARRLRLAFRLKGHSRLSQHGRATQRTALSSYYEPRFYEARTDSQECRLTTTALDCAPVLDDTLERAHQLDTSRGRAPGSELAEVEQS